MHVCRNYWTEELCTLFHIKQAEKGHRVFLECGTPNAEIYYTVDGSYPMECNPNLKVRFLQAPIRYFLLDFEIVTDVVWNWRKLIYLLFVFLKPYNKKKGVVLSQEGLVVVRAIAKKDGWVTSQIYNSKYVDWTFVQLCLFCQHPSRLATCPCV